MPRTLDALRRTGRTTRMLDQAAHVIVSGRPAIILAPRNQTAMYHSELSERFRALGADDRRDLKFAIVTADSEELSRIDWDGLTHRRYESAYPHHALFVDHYVLERAFGGLLNLLHAYDPPIALQGAPAPPQQTQTIIREPRRRILRK